MKVTFYISGWVRKSWKWRAVAPNGKILAHARGFNTEELARENFDTLVNYIKNDMFQLETKIQNNHE